MAPWSHARHPVQPRALSALPGGEGVPLTARDPLRAARRGERRGGAGRVSRAGLAAAAGDRGGRHGRRRLPARAPAGVAAPAVTRAGKDAGGPRKAAARTDAHEESGYEGNTSGLTG